MIPELKKNPVCVNEPHPASIVANCLLSTPPFTEKSPLLMIVPKFVNPPLMVREAPKSMIKIPPD